MSDKILKIYCYGAGHGNGKERFVKLKRTHPELWDYCMKPVSQGGLGMRDVLEYIGFKVE